MNRIFLSDDGEGMPKLKTTLREDYHSDNKLNWIEDLICDVVNMIDLDYSLDDIVSCLKEHDISDDMIFLIVSAARIYESDRIE